ncbi:MAG TPA: hypothetical protein VJU77_16865 [Chthoniobacterales bacterium]|nr:hypothetical protein [Chthoniobacterales bacterium]
MNSQTGKPFGKKSFAIRSLRIAAFVLVLFAAGQEGYAQGRVEDDVRRKAEEKKDIARRQEAAERARVEAGKTTEKLNETKSLNKTESLNKERALIKPEIRDEAKLRSASEALKKSGAKEAAAGTKKPSEVGNPTSGGAAQARARNPGKTK